MDGFLRIGTPERSPELRQVKREKRDGKQRRFEPARIIEDLPPKDTDDETAERNGPATKPVGPRPGDETGATIDVTA